MSSSAFWSEVDDLKPKIQYVVVRVLIHHSSPRTHRTYIRTHSRFPPRRPLHLHQCHLHKSGEQPNACQISAPTMR
jgi:hypothetical protein